MNRSHLIETMQLVRIIICIERADVLNEMTWKKRLRIGIIICDRYRRCAGGNCFRSLGNREGAFSL